MSATGAGYDTWFFVTADYAFGHDLEHVTTDVIKANGGQVRGGDAPLVERKSCRSQRTDKALALFDRLKGIGCLDIIAIEFRLQGQQF
jgi:hypothetical protein